jgi:pimeloyl-ACP methyl ester carboxylesterase
LALVSGCASLSSDQSPDHVRIRDADGAKKPDGTYRDEDAASWAVRFARYAVLSDNVYLNQDPDLISASRKQSDEMFFCASRKSRDHRIEVPKSWTMVDAVHKINSNCWACKGLAYEIWRLPPPAPAGPAEYVISFRGTDGPDVTDWWNNLRWITRLLPGDDQYDWVHKNISALTETIRADATKAGIVDYNITSTGHSLGGGLAQMAAYASGRIKRAVVFDPSPVTGWSDLELDSATRAANVKDLTISRVYEKGEGLAYLRSLFRILIPLRRENPAITEFRFSRLHGDAVSQHSMRALACEMADLGKRPGLAAR